MNQHLQNNRSLSKWKSFKGSIILFALMLITISASSQTSTAKFENETTGSTTFTDNGVTFNILSHVNTYDIMANYPGTGWSGTANDNVYIDNTGTGNQSSGTSFSIKTTSNLFKVNRFYVYCGAANLTLGVVGTLTITGKLSGVTKFTQTKTTGFTGSLATANGYTLIDMTNLNGQNYSNIVIDQLQLTAGGNFQYLAFDAFTWVKDSGMVLPVSLTDFNASLSKTGALKAEWKTASEKNNSHFILQGSQDGKTWKDLVRKEAAVGGANGASYSVETNIGTISLAGFGLLGFLLLPFANRRYRMLAMLAVLSLVALSCAKDGDGESQVFPDGKVAANTTVYVRLAQVDHDGTTTYSEVLAVKAK